MEKDRPRRSAASQDGERSGESGAGAKAKRPPECQRSRAGTMRSVVLSTSAPALVQSDYRSRDSTI